MTFLSVLGVAGVLAATNAGAALPPLALDLEQRIVDAENTEMASVADFEVSKAVPTRGAVPSKTSEQTAERYFEVDEIVSLAALALATGILIAGGIARGRRRKAERPVQTPQKA